MFKPEIIYEDNHLLVVIKPQGIAVQKDNSKEADMQTILQNYLKEKYNKPGKVFVGIVHRLDQPVGGVMVFAKTSKSAARLSEQIRKRIWKKEYLTITDGIPFPENGEMEDYLKKEQNDNKVFIVDSNDREGKKAILGYETIKSKNNRALLKINLKTGRSHQIRVQLSSRGFPIVNDHKYNKIFIQNSNIALWSYSLTILHPVKMEEMTFTSDMPEKFYDLLNSSDNI